MSALFRIDVDWPGAGTSMVIACVDQSSADDVARHKARRQSKLLRGELRKLVTWRATPVDSANESKFNAKKYDPANDRAPWPLPAGGQ